ncbi:hypothetical protein CTheo_1841 [Ceratobasidium theobromae]|uniref:Transmembrane protein n=1 Tax=Ceratobasidium theobromae TaxID=1582974 RepID=A0A5N5QSM6_9AGAM|nr:hypothetical protein CTheo_1841 [Ceratobasidium theobromae]
MRATFFALAAALFSTGALAGPIVTSVIVLSPSVTTQYYQSDGPHFTYITIQSPQAPSVTATTIASCIRNCGSYSYNEPGAVTTTQVLQPSFTVFPITESRSATAFTIQTSSVYGPGPSASASASPATSAMASASASASASPVASDSRTTLFATGVPSASLSLNSTSTASVDPLNTINSNGAMEVAVGSAFAVVVGAVSVLALL